MDPITCIWWPTAMLGLDGGPLPNPAWPIFSFLNSSGWWDKWISPKTQLHITIGLLLIYKILQAALTSESWVAGQVVWLGDWPPTVYHSPV